MRVGSDWAKKLTVQLLKQEYANLKFKDDESVEDFSLRLQLLISKLRRRGCLQVPPLRASEVHPYRSLYRDNVGLVHPHH